MTSRGMLRLLRCKQLAQQRQMGAAVVDEQNAQRWCQGRGHGRFSRKSCARVTFGAAAGFHEAATSERSGPMRLITDAEVAQLVNMREAIHAMGAAFEQFG